MSGVESVPRWWRRNGERFEHIGEKGTVYSFTTTHTPNSLDPNPITIALIMLDIKPKADETKKHERHAFRSQLILVQLTETDAKHPKLEIGSRVELVPRKLVEPDGERGIIVYRVKGRLIREGEK